MVQDGLFAPVVVFLMSPLFDAGTALAQSDRFDSEVMSRRLRVLAHALQPQSVFPRLGLEVQEVPFPVGKVVAVHVERLTQFYAVQLRLIAAVIPRPRTAHEQPARLLGLHGEEEFYPGVLSLLRTVKGAAPAGGSSDSSAASLRRFRGGGGRRLARRRRSNTPAETGRAPTQPRANSATGASKSQAPRADFGASAGRLCRFMAGFSVELTRGVFRTYPTPGQPAPGA